MMESDSEQIQTDLSAFFNNIYWYFQITSHFCKYDTTSKASTMNEKPNVCVYVYSVFACVWVVVALASHFPAHY